MNELLGGGFYRAVEPNKEYISICEPVSKNIALAI